MICDWFKTIASSHLHDFVLIDLRLIEVENFQ